jgi:hypothetical protein
VPCVMLLHFLSGFGHWCRDDQLRDVFHPVVSVLTTDFDCFKRKPGGQLRGPSTLLKAFTNSSSMSEVLDLTLDRDNWRTTQDDAVLSLQLRLLDRTLTRREKRGLLSPERHSAILTSMRRVYTKLITSRRRNPD